MITHNTRLSGGRPVQSYSRAPGLATLDLNGAFDVETDGDCYDLQSSDARILARLLILAADEAEAMGK